jgi:hypothetical protein
MAKKTDKLFIVKKYIWAQDAKQAIRKDKTHPVEDVWIDDEWKRNSNTPKDAMGFYVPDNNEE